jgi:hypothetical protein
LGNNWRSFDLEKTIQNLRAIDWIASESSEMFLAEFLYARRHNDSELFLLALFPVFSMACLFEKQNKKNLLNQDLDNIV